MTGVEPEIAAQDTLSCALGSVHDLPRRDNLNWPREDGLMWLRLCGDGVSL